MLLYFVADSRLIFTQLAAEPSFLGAANLA